MTSKNIKCPKCDADMESPEEEGEVASCPCCGYEMVKDDGKVIPLDNIIIEGIDWGE